MNEAHRVAYENELVSTEGTNMGALAAVSSAGSFLPRVQLFGGNSEACKEGRIPIGHYGLVRDKETIEDLTNDVEFLVIAGRPKAMEINGDVIITNYDHTSEEFTRIAQESETPDSGCMYGPEFLIYVPEAHTFATLYLSSKTARRESGSLSSRLGKAARATSHLIKGKKFSWHGPKFHAVTEPTFELPDVEEITKQRTAFLNPKSSEVEKDDSTGGRER